MSYQPKPIDTTGVAIPGEVHSLLEQLAQHTHDLWAQQRMHDGWTYGARRDDASKQHPDLVPYSELSEAEKSYDRNTALGTLKAILALGYRIVPPGKP